MKNESTQPEDVRKRTKQPGAVGLANEPRPGRGPREKDVDPAAASEGKESAPSSIDESESPPRATRRGYDEPRPEPREQDPDSLAHDEERSTGVSGHSGST